MAKWRQIVDSIESLKGLALQDDLVAELERHGT